MFYFSVVVVAATIRFWGSEDILPEVQRIGLPPHGPHRPTHRHESVELSGLPRAARIHWKRWEFFFSFFWGGTFFPLYIGLFIGKLFYIFVLMGRVCTFFSLATTFVFYCKIVLSILLVGRVCTFFSFFLAIYRVHGSHKAQWRDGLIPFFFGVCTLKMHNYAE